MSGMLRWRRRVIHIQSLFSDLGPTHAHPTVVHMLPNSTPMQVGIDAYSAMRRLTILVEEQKVEEGCR